MRHARLFVLGMVFCGCAAAGSAQTVDDGLRQQLTSLTAQVHQLESEQTNLQTQKDAAEKERDSLKKQVAELLGQLAKTARPGDATAQTSGPTGGGSAPSDQVSAIADRQSKILDACQAKNDRLFAVANKILDAYENLDFSEDSEQRRSFVVFRRVEIENAAQTYEDEVRNAKFDSAAALQPIRQTNSQTVSSPKTP